MVTNHLEGPAQQDSNHDADNNRHEIGECCFVDHDAVHQPGGQAQLYDHGDGAGDTADHRQITEAVADAYVLGHLPDFAAFAQSLARKLDLPTYPFEHKRFWIDRAPQPGFVPPATIAAANEANDD